MRILVATAAGTVVYFLFGWLVFEGLLGRFMAAHTTQLAGFKKDAQEASMALLILSCAAYALLLALLFDQWAAVRDAGTGLARGAVVGVLVAVMTNSYWYATSHFFLSWKPLVADVLAAGVTVGAMGAAIGWCLGALPHGKG
jgi:hypothetical protein